MQIFSVPFPALAAEPTLPGFREMYNDLLYRVQGDWLWLILFVVLLQLLAFGSIWLAGLVVSEDADNVRLPQAFRAWLVSAVLFVVILVGAYLARHYILAFVRARGMVPTATLVDLLPSLFIGAVVIGTACCIALVAQHAFRLSFGIGLVCALIAMVLTGASAFGLKFAFRDIPKRLLQNLEGWPGEYAFAGGPNRTPLARYFEIQERRANDPKRTPDQRAQIQQLANTKLEALKTAGPDQTPAPAYFDLLEGRAADKGRSLHDRSQSIKEIYPALQSLYRLVQRGDKVQSQEYERRLKTYQDLQVSLKADLAAKPQ